MFKKQKKVSMEEFVSSMNTISIDMTKIKTEINDVKNTMTMDMSKLVKEINDIKSAYVCMSKDLDTANYAIGGLIEIIKNNSTKKQLEAKNELSDGNTFTTKELYDIILTMID